MWSLTNPSNHASGRITPTKVLYEYDGPLIFSANFGFMEAFFVKIDGLEESDLFVVTQIDSDLVNLIDAGQISVRSAFNRDFFWIVETKENLSIHRYWVCQKDELPEYFLPEKNTSLHRTHEFVPDSLDQLNAFFSVDYQGLGLKREIMRFSQFKQLIDSTHEAVRNILSPIVLLGSKTATFDFNISEPVFSSLVINIQTPTVNKTNVERKIRGQDMDIAVVNEQFSLQRDAFFDEMEEIIFQAERGSIEDSLVEERFSLLDRVQPVIPTEENQLSSVLFSANQGNKFAHLFVSEKAGGVINRAFRAAESRPVEEFGTVDVTNDPSRSFVIMSRRGKQVTCYATFENYQELKADPRFRNGVTLKARGHLTRRTRRDILHVDGLPVILG